MNGRPDGGKSLAAFALGESLAAFALGESLAAFSSPASRSPYRGYPIGASRSDTDKVARMRFAHLRPDRHLVDDDHESEAQADGKTKSAWPGRLDVIIAIALGLAAVVGAFAAYKNEQRNHAASALFSEGITKFEDASHLNATANSTLARDQSQFLAYVTALHDNKPVLARFILHDLMDSTLRAAVKWWQSPANTSQPTPARTPFTSSNPDYVIPQQAQAANREKASTQDFAEAKTQQEHADHFTLIEVILATALFLYGIAGVTRSLPIKLGTLGTGGLIFLISLLLLITG
jgi:hypothetical protein